MLGKESIMTMGSRFAPDQGQRLKAAELLQGTLVDILDLALQGKQAHWNLVGPHFRELHLQLDEMVDSCHTAGDEIAERMLALGAPADGRAATIAATSRVEAFPGGEVRDSEVVRLVAGRLAAVVEHVREVQSRMGELDVPSEDLLIGLTATLEKQLWTIQASEK
jgi:starvation-inducible DNA-binding protein